MEEKTILLVAHSSVWQKFASVSGAFPNYLNNCEMARMYT